MELDKLLSQNGLVQEYPRAQDIRERASLSSPIKLFYGETYDDKGHTIDSMKYYLFVADLADSLREEGFFVDPTILVADTAACRNIKPTLKDRYMSLGNERADFIRKVNDIYGTGLKILKMSDYIDSDKFLSVNQMMQWAVIGLFFKSASWPIGFIFMAKSKPKQFFWNQLISSIYFLGFNLLGYYYWGLTGLGMSFIINYMLHLLQMIIVGKIYHEFNYKRDLYILLIIQFTLGIMCFSCVYFPFKYITGILLIIVSIWYSYRELDVRLGITEKLKQL